MTADRGTERARRDDGVSNRALVHAFYRLEQRPQSSPDFWHLSWSTRAEFTNDVVKLVTNPEKQFAS